MKTQGKLKRIESELEAAKRSNAMAYSILSNQALGIMGEALKENEELAKLIQSVENSKDLTQTPHDEFFSQWIRVYDFSKFIDTESEFQKDLFQTYMSDSHCIGVDYENDCLTYSIGPSILINEEGDVLDQDSGKWIISKSDYFEEDTEEYSEEKRNQLIEEYMEKTGYFPSVITCDRYGNAFYINTKTKEGK